MPNLLTKKCVPCEGGATPLTREEAAELGRQTPEWEISDDGKKITRTIKFKNFKETSTFFNKVAECGCFLKIFKFDCASDLLPIVTDLPLRRLSTKFCGFLSRERCSTAFAGNTFFGEEVWHL